eukprot:scaffold47681_cov26-Attheya_sp.AAC.1
MVLFGIVNLLFIAMGIFFFFVNGKGKIVSSSLSLSVSHYRSPRSCGSWWLLFRQGGGRGGG